MAITIVDGAATDVDYRKQSLRFENAVNKRGKMRFTSREDAPPLDIGEDVYVKDGATVLWGGTVEGYVERDIKEGSTTVRQFEYECVDFDEIADRKLVAATYTNATAGSIVESIRASYLNSEGVTAGTITAGPTIVKIVFSYVTATEALNELAELSGYYWCIDKNKALQFEPRDAALSAFNLTAGNKPYFDLAITRNRSKFRNTQYVRAGYDLTASRVEVQAGDGSRQAFLMEYEVGSAPTIRVDTGGGYGSQTVGILGVDTGKQWYYTIGSNVISQDSGETALATTDLLEVTYQGRYPIIVKAELDTSITERAAAESGTGVYEAVVDDASIDDDDAALDKANGLLQRYGSIPVTIRYQTHTGGLVAGTLQTITLADHGLDDQYLLESVEARTRDDDELVYFVTALSGQAFGSWAEFFRSLVKKGRDYVIRDNEVLVILKSPQDNVTVADAPTTATYTGAYTVNGSDTYINGFHVG